MKAHTHFLFSYLLLILALISACNDPTTIGIGLIEEEEFLNSYKTDTFTLQLTHIRPDSTRVAPILGVNSSGSITYRNYVLGATNDPVFGLTAAKIYVGPKLSSTQLEFGEGATLDSIVLSLTYSGSSNVYGDSLQAGSYYVYEMLETPVDTIAYYSEKTFPTGDLLGYTQARFRPKDDVVLRRYGQITTNGITRDTIYIDTIATPQLRIPLSTELGNRFLQADTSVYQNEATFKQFFKGLYITPALSNNSMAYFDLRSSKLLLYYHNATSKGKSQAFPLFLSDRANAVNHFTHSYENTTVGNALTAATPNAQHTGYMQGLNGVGLRLDIPYLKNLPELALINQAKLEFTVLPNTETIYAPPYDLLFAFYDTIRSYPATFGYKVNNNIKTYTLYLNNSTPEAIAGLLDEKVRRIFVELQEENPARLVIGGPDHPTYPMKLQIIYTPTDQ